MLEIEEIQKYCKKINMREMAADVGPFLFSEKDKSKVLIFEEFIKQQTL